MLIFDIREIGNRLLGIRKMRGLTQAETAELSGLSDRAYADIERGLVNTRTETILRICNALSITPDDLFTVDNTDLEIRQDELFVRLGGCTPSEKSTALELLSVYLKLWIQSLILKTKKTLLFSRTSKAQLK